MSPNSSLLFLTCFPHNGAPPEPSAPVRERVTVARSRQIERAGVVNAQFDLDGLKRHWGLGVDSRPLLGEAAEKQALSPRACHRILKVARTLADLDDADTIRVEHLAEAICYRGIANRVNPLY